jgi:hypothetical protein
MVAMLSLLVTIAPRKKQELSSSKTTPDHLAGRSVSDRDVGPAWSRRPPLMRVSAITACRFFDPERDDERRTSIRDRFVRNLEQAPRGRLGASLRSRDQASLRGI